MKNALCAVIAIAAGLWAASALAHGPRCPASDNWQRIATQEACLYYRTSDGAGFWFEFEAQLPRDADGTVIGPAYRLWVCSRQGNTNEDGHPNYCFAPAYVDEIVAGDGTVEGGHRELFRRWKRTGHDDVFTHRRLGGNRVLRVEPQTKANLEQNILPGLLQCLDRDFDSVFGEDRTVDQMFLNQSTPRWCEAEVLDQMRGPTRPGSPIRNPWGGAPGAEPSAASR